jgi:predicted transcriptional regulator
MEVMKPAHSLEPFGRTDVVASILETAEDDTTDVGRGKISSETSLSNDEIDDYLSIMTKQELLRYDTIARTYRTTRKGRAYLKKYRDMGEFISIIQEEIGL